MKKVYLLVIAMLCSMLFGACGANASQTFEIEPCLKYIGIPLEGASMNVSEEDASAMNNAVIADVSGEITYAVKTFGKAFDIAGTMTWKSDADCSNEQFRKVKDSLISYYEIDTGEMNVADLGEIKCRNDIYTIECRQDDSGYIIITWVYNVDLYDQNKVAGYAAVNMLRSILKNPDSLQVHNIGYTTDAYCLEKENAIGIRIDYSAQNSFGGYTRDHYYVWITPDGYRYTSVQTFLGAEKDLEDASFVHFSIDNKNDLYIPYSNEYNTILVNLSEQSYPTAESIMDDSLINYLQYLSMSYVESGFNIGQASDARGKRYELEDAEFLGELCEIDLVFDSTEDDAKPIGLEVGCPVCSYSLEEIRSSLCERLDTEPAEDGDIRVIIRIPETDFEIKVYQVSDVLPADIIIRYTTNKN